ncbi:hypothetical protein F4802DRAFT_216653 [Xylaria palmicola]|nr:hypothetical protein F4802DRAFT_216653 [Xylaria palmicola]
MRLICSRTHGGYKRSEVHEFIGEEIPEYAILSHTWGKQEVTLQDMQHLDEQVKRKDGFKKIMYSCDQAERDEISWVWIDTCCIDKSSSAELSEAINSMYGWYGDSSTCYAYLADVPIGDDIFAKSSAFRMSRWFTRGWTLQELIAPREIKFYDAEWERIGTKGFTESTHRSGDKRIPQGHFGTLLEAITGIPEACLANTMSPSFYSVAKRMSWASKRQCTRVEDVAYSLLGIFGINMPLLYGEGVKAFMRLQEEIMKEIDDHSILAWTIPENTNQLWIPGGIFARSPADFALSGDVSPIQEELGDLSTVTRKGLKISLDLQPFNEWYPYEQHCIPQAFYAILNCAQGQYQDQRVALLLIPDISTSTKQPRTFYRCATAEHLVAKGNSEFRAFHAIYIHKNVPPEVSQGLSTSFSSKKSLSRQTFSGRNMLRRLHHLSSIFSRLGRYSEAEVMYREILATMEKDLGKEHLPALANLRNLALIVQSLGRHEEAEVLHRQTLEGREKTLGKDDPDTLRSIEDIALVLQSQGNYEEAERLHREVLHKRKKTLGEYHWDTLTSYNNMALVSWDLGKHEPATEFHRLAWEGRKRVLGGVHPDTVRSLLHLVSALSMSNGVEEAKGLIEEALPIMYDVLVEGHPAMQTIYNGLLPASFDRSEEKTKLSAIAWVTKDRQTPPATRIMRVPWPEPSSSGHVASSGIPVHSLINDLINFANLIRTIPYTVRPVKIAILGYGFYDASDVCDDNFVSVKSFGLPEKSASALNTYFSGGEGNHWMQISALISPLCPKSRLYVALLEESSKTDDSGEPKATARSAEQAFRWALSCGVDIIYLSCAIDADQSKREIKLLLDRIQASGIPLLRQTTKDPIDDLRRKNIIPIGTADGTDYFLNTYTTGYDFPCRNVSVVHKQDMTVSCAGNLVPMATASALAGFILFCWKVVGIEEYEPAYNLVRFGFNAMSGKKRSVWAQNLFFRLKYPPMPDNSIDARILWNEALKEALTVWMKDLLNDGYRHEI